MPEFSGRPRAIDQLSAIPQNNQKWPPVSGVTP